MDSDAVQTPRPLLLMVLAAMLMDLNAIKVDPFSPGGYSSGAGILSERLPGGPYALMQVTWDQVFSD
jgi:hypothetical protein